MNYEQYLLTKLQEKLSEACAHVSRAQIHGLDEYQEFGVQVSHAELIKDSLYDVGILLDILVEYGPHKSLDPVGITPEQTKLRRKRLLRDYEP